MEEKTYLEKDALLRAFGGTEFLTMQDAATAMQLITEAPAAPVAPIRYGEWRWHEEWSESTPDGAAECQSAGWLCSECGTNLGEYLTECGEHCYFDNADEKPKVKCCPHCGATMTAKTP